MTTSAEKAQALAAIADLKTLMPRLKSAVTELARGGTQHYGVIFMASDTSGNQIPPAVLFARLDAIVSGATTAETIVSGVTAS